MPTELWATRVWLFATVMGALERVTGRALDGDDRGNITMQQVIWYAVTGALAIAVGGVIVGLVMAKTGGINLDTPTP